MTARIAILSCDALLPGGDPGDLPLVTSLADRGAEVSVRSWSDPDVAWNTFDLAILRSTWDYTARRADFLQSLADIPRLQNPFEVVRANTDKVYLRSLQDADLPVVRTTFVDPGEAFTLPASGQFVIKPSVGAGSRGAGRFDASRPGESDRAAEHAAALHAAGRTLLIQPYLEGVDEAGETAMIFIDGEFSHAIRKGRMLGEGDTFEVDSEALFVPENISARQPSDAELDVARRILNHLSPDGPLLYARIDLLPSPDGPVLVEAELTEPSLFLDRVDKAADRLAAAILDRVG